MKKKKDLRRSNSKPQAREDKKPSTSEAKQQIPPKHTIEELPKR